MLKKAFGWELRAKFGKEKSGGNAEGAVNCLASKM